MVLHAKEVNIECGVRERDFQSVTEDSPEKEEKNKKNFSFFVYPTERKCVAAQGSKRTK
jgi:hypothetical protein